MSDELPKTEVKSILPVETNSDEVVKMPPSLEYIAALSPESLTPITFRGETRGARIAIVDPREEKAVINIYRFVSKYVDGNYGVQDEIMFSGENKGTQMNFEFTDSGDPVKFPQGDFSALAQRAVSVIHELSTVEGASIDGNEGMRYVSNGTSWVETRAGKGVDKTSKRNQIEPRRQQLE